MVMDAQELVVMGSQEMIKKGKRTKRPRALSPLRLSAAVTSSSSSSTGGVVTANEIENNNMSMSSSTPATSIEFSTAVGGGEEEDMANCLILLAQGTQKSLPKLPSNFPSSSKGFVYECKTCNRCFPSFQALGGHRASHKRPNNAMKTTSEEKKIATQENEEGVDQVELSLQILPNKSLFGGSNNNNGKFSGFVNASSSISTTNYNVKPKKIHECSICRAEFSSGQALGGHMRRHRAAFTSNTNSNPAATAAVSLVWGGAEFQQEAKKPRNSLPLDLNLPAPEDDHIRESKFQFASKEQVLVFSTSSLVDCHY